MDKVSINFIFIYQFYLKPLSKNDHVSSSNRINFVSKIFFKYLLFLKYFYCSWFGYSIFLLFSSAYFRYFTVWSLLKIKFRKIKTGVLRQIFQITFYCWRGGIRKQFIWQIRMFFEYAPKCFRVPRRSIVRLKE